MRDGVLLISPPVISTRERFYIPDYEIPLNVCYLAAALEQAGVKCSIIDMNVAPPDFSLAEFVAKSSPALVGFTAYTPFINTAHQYAADIKQTSPTTAVVAGGYHVSALPERSLNEFPSFDFLIRGEGEQTLVDLYKAITDAGDTSSIPGLYYRNSTSAAAPKPREQFKDIDSLPFPARHLLDNKKYRVNPINYVELPTTGILASRGCEMRCAFCSQSVYRGARVRSAAGIVEEVQQCRRDFGVRGFRFYDDNLTAYRDTCLAFCAELRKRNIAISWNCFSRVDSVDAELLAEIKSAGCHQLKFGVETGTEHMLGVINKRITLDQSRAAVQLAKQAGIETQISIIIGLPDETRDEILKTISFAISLSPDLAGFNLFKPLPGSPLYSKLEREGRLLHHNWPDYSIKQTRPTAAGILPAEELEELLSHAYLSFFLRPSYFFQRLKWFMRRPKRELLRLAVGIKYIISNTLHAKT